MFTFNEYKKLIPGVLFDPAELRDVPASMSSFRRCNYPQLNIDGQSYIALSCGRYSSFNDIPTIWWQLTTVLMGVGCAVSLYVAVRAVFSLCMAYVLDTSSVKTLGLWQFVAACCISTGGALFPLGWNHLEVQELCGYLSRPFDMGKY
ncbi:LHFPL tetraspan subfamily member 1 protein-like [Diaphorina citri]|uniref:LHFPL tetraspan subfamily member 1 protein-like n=1 Tax=Diaphorina citri TaxID=121845 RepID=A0A1S3DG62_DIACI|nr:LHFPL tetraspan subfamily member 1 protein-like [Diaphorina citri]